jgi:hypothetical protein
VLEDDTHEMQRTIDAPAKLPSASSASTRQ